MVMIEVLAFAFVAVALALPALGAVLVRGDIESGERLLVHCKT
jgi:hypothetical protein